MAGRMRRKRKHMKFENIEFSTSEISEDQVGPPTCVSNWTIKEMERFHIHYADKAVNHPLEILRTAGILENPKTQKLAKDNISQIHDGVCKLFGEIKEKPPTLDPEVVSFIDSLSFFRILDFLDFDLPSIEAMEPEGIVQKIKFIDSWGKKFSEGCKSHLPYNAEFEENEKRCPGLANAMLRSIGSVSRFLGQLKYILYMLANYGNIQETAYRDLFSHFSECCMMIPTNGDNELAHISLLIKDKLHCISSKPDIRYLKTIQVSEFDEKIPLVFVVSVAKAKDNQINEDDGIKIKNFPLELEPEYGTSDGQTGPKASKLKDPSSSVYPADSISGGNSIDEEAHNYSSEQFPCEDFNINCLNSSILAQHAGELLIEWKSSAFTPFILGSIVLQTKVILTCMRISPAHVRKLVQGREYNEKAAITYSKPLDFLHRGDRNILTDILLRIGLSQLN